MKNKQSYMASSFFYILLIRKIIKNYFVLKDFQFFMSVSSA